MKSKILVLFSLFVAIITARAVPISQWTFETSIPTTAGPHTAEGGVSPGTALGSHAGVAVYSNPVGNGSAESFSSTVWAVGDYYQFQLSTVGYENIMVSWDQTSSSTGPRDFKLQYDYGSGLTDVASYTVLENLATGSGGNGLWNTTTAISAYHYSFDLSAIAAIENLATVYFRLTDRTTTSVRDVTVATSGTDRVDNFTVSGTPITTHVPDTGTTAILLSISLLGLYTRLRFTTRSV